MQYSFFYPKDILKNVLENYLVWTEIAGSGEERMLFCHYNAMRTKIDM